MKLVLMNAILDEDLKAKCGSLERQRYITAQNAYKMYKKSQKNKGKKSKHHHVWAAVGQDFKSDLTFYDVPGNTNGKMPLAVYRDKILEPVVKPWILQARNGLIDPFVFEEDGDTGHGTGKNNIVRSWKAENKLDSYFNCPSSPDLSPIEKCWQAPKQYLRRIPHWDDDTTKELIVEGWDSFPRCYRTVLMLKGK